MIPNYSSLDEDIIKLVTELSDGELLACGKAATELAGKAAEHHKQMVEDAHSRLKTVFDELRVEIEREGGGKWAITVRNNAISKDEWTTVVALTNMDGDDVLGHFWEIGVKTEYVMENAAQSVSCGYRTRMVALVDGMEELGLPDGALLTEIVPPLFTGTVVV